MDDPELRELFESEVRERSARLAEGAGALAAGSLDREAARDLLREGHTVKGTARMMGFLAVSEAGRALEECWRAIHDGTLDISAELGGAIADVAGCLSVAVGADPEAGTPELADALGRLKVVVGAASAEPPATIAPTEPDPAPGQPGELERGDLGGLLGSIDSWAFGENVRVNAARLFRLINEICSLRVDVEALVAATGDLIMGGAADPGITGGLRHLQGQVLAADRLVGELQTQAVDLAAVPIAETTNTFPQLVRYLARKAGKEIRFELVGDDHTIDRQVLDRISDALRQLIVNAVHHGIETIEERAAVGKPPTGTVSLRARVDDHRLEVTVEDDGRGVDWQAVRDSAVRRGLLPYGEAADPGALRSLLFSPAFSTVTPGGLVSDGDGLATVAEAVEALHGSVGIETEPGKGTRVRFTVPTSRALQDALLVAAGGQTWGVPAISVLDVIPIADAVIEATERGREMEWSGTPVDVVSFADIVDLTTIEPPSDVVVLDSPVGPIGYTVASVLGRRQVAARELGPILGGVPHLTGAALLGGGDVVVLVDAGRLAEKARSAPERRGPRPRVLVVDDSRGARQIVGGALGSAGFEVGLAATPEEALTAVADRPFDGIVVDYMLPTMDGAELVARIRRLGIAAPVVMLSGQATPEDQARALEAGVDAYFDKDDVRRGALAASLATLIERHRAEQGAAA